MLTHHSAISTSHVLLTGPTRLPDLYEEAPRDGGGVGEMGEVRWGTGGCREPVTEILTFLASSGFTQLLPKITRFMQGLSHYIDFNTSQKDKI